MLDHIESEEGYDCEVLHCDKASCLRFRSCVDKCNKPCPKCSRSNLALISIINAVDFKASVISHAHSMIQKVLEVNNVN